MAAGALSDDSSTGPDDRPRAGARSCPTSPPSRPGGRGGRRAPPRAAHPGSMLRCCRSGKRSGASPRSRCGRCGRPPRSTPRRWTASPCGPPRPSAPPRPRRCCWTTSRSSTPATRCRPATTPSSCASTCTTCRTGAPSCAPLCRPISTSARSARTSAPPSCCSPRATGCAPSTSRPAPRRASSSCVVRRRPRVAIIPTGDEIRPVGTALAPGEIADTNSMMLAAQAAEVGCETRTTGIVADDPELIAAAVREAAPDADLVILIAGSSAGRDDYTARVVATVGSLAVHGVAVRPGSPGRPGHRRRRSGHPDPGSPRLPRLGRADLRHLRRTDAGCARRCRPARASGDHRSTGPQAGVGASARTTGYGYGWGGSAVTSWPRRCRVRRAC